MNANTLPGQPHIAYQANTLCMEKVKLADVVAQFGTPVFAYSKASMLSALAAGEYVLEFTIKTGSQTEVITYGFRLIP